MRNAIQIVKAFTCNPFTAAILLAACIAVLPSCTAMPEAIAARDRAAGYASAITDELETLRLARSTLPEGDPRRDAIDTRIAILSTKQSAASEAVAQLDDLLSASEFGATIDREAGWIRDAVPAPFGLPVLMGVGLAAAIGRASQLKKSAASIAQSLEAAMGDDPALREALKNHKAKLRQIQTPTAQKIVATVKRSAASTQAE